MGMQIIENTINKPSEPLKKEPDFRCQHCGGCWDGEREICGCGGEYVPHEGHCVNNLQPIKNEKA